jgi:hypothetical protein
MRPVAGEWHQMRAGAGTPPYDVRESTIVGDNVASHWDHAAIRICLGRRRLRVMRESPQRSRNHDDFRAQAHRGIRVTDWAEINGLP